MKKKVLFLLIFFAPALLADWQLCNHASKLSFITSLNEKVTEVHSFTNMEGSILKNGNAQIKIDLTSVETHNSLRNLRLQDLLFETSKFPEANVSASLGKDFINALQINKATEVPVQATLNLHGFVKKIDTHLLVTRLKSNCLLITTIEPILISLKDFGFLEGLEKLRQTAELESISSTVSVSLNLFFRSDEAI